MTNLQSDAPRAKWHSGLGGFMLREWPYLLMLLLAVVGVAYTSFVQDSLYWVILTPLIGLICIAAGWPETETSEHRVRLVLTQVLHWGAVLVAMELMSLQVTRQVSGLASALGVLTLLALGTFTAGLHMRTWRVAAVGVILGISVPAIAFLQQSSLLIMLILGLIVAIIVPFFWAKRRSEPAAPPLFEQPFTPPPSTPQQPAGTSARPVPQPPLYETPVSAPIPMPPPAPTPAPTPSLAEPVLPSDTGASADPETPPRESPPDNVRNISGAR
ncbi:hypothetical protein DNX69_02810 [Rhodopseudomonas palustris]|uniref:Transmembrane protein n=1 Tax=Rhodopseudomonas palustris TaxID=1076 RepID=A0A323ULQ7_RHOPL|nr:hypothetical protein [Rhodopseudomonas palustris]PZA13319.1 hypothetical protein DNX69_02810 [Rhodopseudomonas palustris]